MKRTHRNVRVWAGLVLLLLGLTALYSCTLFRKGGAAPSPAPSAVPPAAGAPQAQAPAAQPVPSLVEEFEDPTTFPKPGLPFGNVNKDPAVVLKDFPRDAIGADDWVKAFKENVIKPRGTLEEGKPETPPFPFDIEIPAVGAMPNVIFPHFPHTFWLDCANCHPAIFIMKKGSNPISMVKIVNGEFCGRCHGRVAFPISNCTRCHVKPKG